MPSSITAIIPAYNADKTIETAILSVLNQSEPPDELIVVDDGSTDNTIMVVEKLGDRVRLIRQKNQGAAAARQTATDIAKSDYIAYLDADDWWPDNKIARYKEIIAKEDIYFMLTDLQRAYPGDSQEAYLARNSSFYPWAKKYFEGKLVNSGIENLYRLEPHAGLSLLLHGFPVYPSTMLVKRRVIENVSGWNSKHRRGEDFDIGLRIARRFPLHYLDEVHAILGLHQVNENAYTYTVSQSEWDILVLKSHLATTPRGLTYHHQLTEALGRKYCGIGYLHRKKGQYALARQNYAKALCIPGRRIHALIRWALSCRP